MKFVLLATFSILLAGCVNNSYSPSSVDSGHIDSSRYAELYDSLRNDVDSKITQKIAFDTDGLFKAPIKILSATPYEEEYSNYKGVELKWKNISDKTIDAIRFRWYGVNAFGEPADMGSLQDGIGAGFTDSPTKKGSTRSGTWKILSRDLKKIVLAYPTEIVFSDGTKWKLK